MSSPAFNEETEYTIKDLMSWDDGNRYELIDGRAYMMAPARFEHQYTVSKLTQIINNFLDDNTDNCMCIVAPFGINLEAELGLSSKNLLEPDLSIFCGDDNIDDNGHHKGPPPWVIEVESPSTRSYDLSAKKAKYQASGVQEYWFINLRAPSVMKWVFKEQDELLDVFVPGDIITSETYPDLSIEVESFFRK